jgi:hypothetical protein
VEDQQKPIRSLTDINRKLQNSNSSFISQSPIDAEVRQNIAFMFKFVNELLQQGMINDFSIFRSSLEQVFKKMIQMNAD